MEKAWAPYVFRSTATIPSLDTQLVARPGSWLIRTPRSAAACRLCAMAPLLPELQYTSILWRKR